MRKLPYIFLIIYLTSVQSETYFPTSDLELDDIPRKNGTKTWGTIFPGTKWCGQGNKAMHEDDFGKYRQTDECCRNHDRCPKKLKAGTYKYGLLNSGSTTILSCKCDEIFYDCLKEAKTITSQAVGILYFDILKRKCFTYDHEKNNGLYKWKANRKFSDNRFIKFVSGII
ncbi:phospholipase A2-like [Microplitis mediator]|uniref:phospholipase A2-like n=1 Tax=Microplitis mediator TaxID=375433 RepID=UPI002552115E|nr:phospholipase A2-like [Microplitis mediator]